MSLEIFRWTQEQFYFIVVFFARPMAALVARIPDPRSRSDILHNLVEEHGDFRSEDYHESTIRQFVQTLGGTIDLETLRPCPAVYALNNLLLGTCTLDELEVGISCLGMIEYAFMHISATIAQTVIQRGWVTPERLTHYALHAEIDERHAEEFFAVVEPRWEEPERRLFIVQGLELGAYVWDRLYRDLYISACSALVPSPPATAAR
jgi:pyrroloquinoline-quinone synthase